MANCVVYHPCKKALSVKMLARVEQYVESYLKYYYEQCVQHKETLPDVGHIVESVVISTFMNFLLDEMDIRNYYDYISILAVDKIVNEEYTLQLKRGQE